MLPLWVPLKPLLGVDRSGGCDDPDHDWTGGCAASASHPRDRLRIVGVRWRPGPSLDPGFGPGIAPDQLEPFFTTKKQSMGMGLCIARTIIESCGVFFGGRASQRRSISRPLAQDSVGVNSVSAIVHVVDDDASFRTSISRLLRQCGYAVESY